MLYVKTKIAQSPLHGIGLFADENISKGTVVWKFTPGFDMKFTKDEILALPDLAQIYFSVYTWKSKKSNKYCLSSDNGKYFNHSLDSNCLSSYEDTEEEVVTRAIKDIVIGEEMTDNYMSFEENGSSDDVFGPIRAKYHLIDELDPWCK